MISSSLATSGCGRANTSLPCLPFSALAARIRTRRLAESRNDSPDTSTVTSRAPVSSCVASVSRNSAAVVASASPDSATTGPSAPADAEALSAATETPRCRPPAGLRARGQEHATPAGHARPPAVPSNLQLRIRTGSQLDLGSFDLTGPDLLKQADRTEPDSPTKTIPRISRTFLLGKTGRGPLGLDWLPHNCPHSPCMSVQMPPVGQFRSGLAGCGWEFEAGLIPAYRPMMNRTRMTPPIPIHRFTGFLGGSGDRFGRRCASR